MSDQNPHLLKRTSLFALFCLSYLPLLFLLAVKVLIDNKKFLHYAGFNKDACITLVDKFGLVIVLAMLALYAVVGTGISISKLKRLKGNAFPITITSIKPKNEEALSYLVSYVLPLLVKGVIGLFEYITFFVLFGIYYKLYSTSSLILINPILNLKYGLYEVEYKEGGSEQPKNIRIISEHRWINEGDELKIIKLSHKLYFAYA